jgi:hypothetical protein
MMFSSPKYWGPIFIWGCLALVLASARPSHALGAGECTILGLDALASEFSDIVREPEARFLGREKVYTEFMSSDSLVGRYPDLAQVLARLEFGMLVSRHFANQNNLSVPDVVGAMIERRNRLADFAERAGELFKSEEPQIELALQAASRNLRVSSADSEQFLTSARQKTDREQAFADADSGLGGQVFGFIGELQVAMRVSGLVFYGRRVRSGLPSILARVKADNPNAKSDEVQNLAEDRVRARVAAYMKKSNPELVAEEFDRKVESLIDKEIDVIFRGPSGKEAWGEVKNLLRIVGERGSEGDDRISSRNLGSILEQAQATRTLIQSLAEETGPIEQHLFIINGITRGAAREFQELGITVHGIVD